jgi:lipopolysaccharide export system protein LptA
LLLILVFALPAWGQRKVIQIKQADKGYIQKTRGESVNILVGSVILEHEGALMYCDSARVYQGINNAEAFGNVVINQGDTIFLYGDRLFYNGVTKIADVYDNVRMKDPEMTLTTEALKFNRANQTAHYTTGGKIVSSENTLTSKMGTYYSEGKLFHFRTNVELLSPRYTIHSDTLIYYSDTEIAKFRGPTKIFNDSSFIYTERGQHNTLTEISHFTTNSYLYDAGKLIKADSMYYESQQGFGRLFGSAYIHDSIENQLIVGDYAEYYSNPENSFVTGNAILSILMEGDSLHIHGDTLLYQTNAVDSVKELRVFYGVRMFKSDFQGIGDSLYYDDRDSIFKMYGAPVLWDDQSQMSADSIYIEIMDGLLDSLHMYNNAFLISITDSSDIDQIRGRDMFGSFRDNKLHEMHVIGNGQTAYHIREGDGTYVGLNRADCSNMIIRFQDNQVVRITFLVKPEAKLYPPMLLPEGEKYLKGFKPRFSERPLSKKDLILAESGTVLEIEETKLKPIDSGLKTNNQIVTP